MIELEDIDTDDDGALTATVELPGGRRVTVEYEADDDFEIDDDEDDGEDDDEGFEPSDLPDMETMQETVRHALARLSAEVLDARAEEVAVELTEAAFQEDVENGVVELDEEIAGLREDLALDGVIVFGDGRMTLLYVAPEEYPDLTVYCLLDDDLEIGDLMVE